MARTLIFIFFGWRDWSLGHYLLHRGLHARMRRRRLTGMAEGEVLHHVIYDHTDSDLIRDPGRRFASFPYFLALMVTTAKAAGIVYFFGAAAAVSYLVGNLVSMAIDDWWHFLAHSDSAGGGRLARAARAQHGAHHATHRCNFAFLTGIVWDWMFGTLSS